MTYREVPLKPEEYHKCTTCNGKGVYLSLGDAHRSEGWVPCKCGDGTVRTRWVHDGPRDPQKPLNFFLKKKNTQGKFRLIRVDDDEIFEAIGFDANTMDIIVR